MSTPQKSTKSGTLYPFFVLFGNFRETRSLKFDKKNWAKFGQEVAIHVKIWQKISEALPISLLYLICH